MKIRLQHDLLAVIILTSLLFVFVALSSSDTIRIIFGLPVLIFCAGYVLTALGFPRKDQLNALETIGLSFVLSFAVVATIGFILNYAPFGIRVYPNMASVYIYMLAASAGA